MALLNDLQYSAAKEISEVFKNTSATRRACDTYAKKHIGGDVIPVAIQGTCSYTAYAGAQSNHVVQFRLKSDELRRETINLVRNIYGHFVPKPMDRIQGISYLDFILANSRVPENSRRWSSWRTNLITNIAKLFALSWMAPQDVDQPYRDRLRHQYERDLLLLLNSLPERFCPIIQDCVVALPVIFSLPMVLLRRVFGVCNIMFNELSCNLFTVIDWTEAKFAPFGLHLHSHQRMISKIDLKKGWIRYADHV
ncbi:hypothetical protein BBP40_003414 [Aspergillus hancockii]|nr:hypothetical protein BBP40_003414 [Aspergillus hancockii]